MGVYWNPSNTSYYRSLERSALNVYLATQGTSGPQSVRTPTGINYVVPATVGGGGGANRPCESQQRVTPDPTLAAALKEAGAGGNITLRKLEQILKEGRLEGRANLTESERSALREAIDAGLFKHKTVRKKAEQLANGGGFSVVGIRMA